MSRDAPRIPAFSWAAMGVIDNLLEMSEKFCLDDFRGNIRPLICAVLPAIH
jgi:hypothetical protein